MSYEDKILSSSSRREEEEELKKKVEQGEAESGRIYERVANDKKSVNPWELWGQQKYVNSIREEISHLEYKDFLNASTLNEKLDLLIKNCQEKEKVGGKEFEDAVEELEKFREQLNGK